MTWELFFFKHAEIEAGRLVQELSLFFQKVSQEIKMVGILVSIYFGSPLDVNIIKVNCIKF